MSADLLLNLLNELNKTYILRAFGEQYIVLFNEFNKFNTKTARIQYPIYNITHKIEYKRVMFAFCLYKDAILIVLKRRYLALF